MASFYFWRLATKPVKNSNPVSWLFQSSLLGICLFLLSACGDGTSAKAAAAAAEPKTIADYFVIKVGDVPAHLQVAVSHFEQERGLMQRRDLGPDDGMVFVYPSPQQLSYWMRNTPTPLDIGYFDAHGVLQEVYPMYPYDETPINSQSNQIQFAVEMHQGWYASKDLKPGARLDLTALAAALKARGFKPEHFGLN